MNRSYMPLSSAGTVLGLDVAGVEKLIQDGTLEWTTWNGGLLYVDEAEVRALLAARQASRLRPIDRPPYLARRAQAEPPRVNRQASAPAGRPVQTNAKPASRPTVTPAPARPPRLRTFAELRAAGVLTAGDEAVAQAAAAAPVPIGQEALTDAQRDAIARLVAVSTLRPADAPAR